MIIGMMRVKNEARWIERSIASILPLCDRVIVLDDHSEDATPELCAAMPNVTVLDSPFSTLDETRDKNWLLEKCDGAEWIVCIDGDEALEPAGVRLVAEAMKGCNPSISLRIPYLWDSESRIRVDGVYGEFRRHSAFRPSGHRFEACAQGGFHCGNAPWRLRAGAVTLGARLLHFGYMEAEDRERKYVWYNAQDPGNANEDRYRHIAAGLEVSHEELIARQRAVRAECGLPELRADQLIPPAPSRNQKTLHAGPLDLESL